MLIFITIIILIGISIFIVYRMGKVYELHKLKETFENKKHSIEKASKNIVYNSEIEGLNDAINIIDDELINLKNFDV